MKTGLLVLASVLLLLNSCATTEFAEKNSMQKNEMTTFGNISLNGEVKLEDLNRLGKVEVTKTITYTLQENGDYTYEMDGYKYTYTALTMKGELEGTRVIGNLKQAEVVTPAAGGGDLLGALLGTVSVEGDESAAPTTRGPKDILLDAVNYELMEAASKKGGVALLMPEYSWIINEDQTGITTAGFFIIPSSRAYKTKTLEYTVTARATAVAL